MRVDNPCRHNGVREADGVSLVLCSFCWRIGDLALAGRFDCRGVLGRKAGTSDDVVCCCSYWDGDLALAGRLDGMRR